MASYNLPNPAANVSGRRPAAGEGAPSSSAGFTGSPPVTFQGGRSGGNSLIGGGPTSGGGAPSPNPGQPNGTRTAKLPGVQPVRNGMPST